MKTRGNEPTFSKNKRKCAATILKLCLKSGEIFEPRCEKTGLWGFRPGPTKTWLYSHRRWLETGNFGFRKKRDCTIHVAKTKALISFVVTAKLICIFVFAYAKSQFSHDKAHL